MDTTNELRLICGHDSYDVDGCVTCEAATLIESLRQQLAVHEANAKRFIEADKYMQRQLDDSQKQVALLRHTIKIIKYETDIHGNNLNKPIRALAIETLAATTDLDGLILCYAEPVAEFIMDGSSLGKTKFLAHSGEPLCNGESLYHAWRPKL